MELPINVIMYYFLQRYCTDLCGEIPSVSSLYSFMSVGASGESVRPESVINISYTKRSVLIDETWIYSIFCIGHEDDKNDIASIDIILGLN